MRRCLSLLLIVAYLLLQAAAVPHAHGKASASSQDHSKRHIHSGSFTHHGHSHQESHSHHEHLAVEHPHDHVPPHESPAEHDSDAIYVPDVVLARVDLSDTNDWSVFAPLAEAILVKSAVDLAAKFDIGLVTRESTGTSVEHCALFLKLRTLRI